MEKILSVEHEKLGILYGRDCIHLDNVIQKGSTLEFKGEINGELASKIQDDIWVSYKLVFKKVIKYYSCELDTYEADENEVHGIDGNVLFVIQDSEHLKNIPVRYDYKKYDYKHFLIYTYDFVFNVFAVDFELKCDFPVAEKVE